MFEEDCVIISHRLWSDDEGFADSKL